MIDIHCHILPGFDDGAADLREAQIMAAMAADSGVDGIVATPHFRGTADTARQDVAVIDRLFEALHQEFTQADLPLTLYKGAEILCLPETPELAVKGLLPTLAGTRYLLTEFYFDEDFDSMSERLAELAACGLVPVVAHPERYGAIQRDPRRLFDWFDTGYVLQLNKGSVLGAFGPRVQQAAAFMLDNGIAHLIASDAHGVDQRTPHMEALRDHLEEHYDPEYIRILLRRNPRRLVEDRPMVPA